MGGTTQRKLLFIWQLRQTFGLRRNTLKGAGGTLGLPRDSYRRLYATLSVVLQGPNDTVQGDPTLVQLL